MPMMPETPHEHPRPVNDPAVPPAPPVGDHRHLPSRAVRNAVFVVIGGSIVAGWIGDALWASLVDRSPLTLVLLNAKPRYQLLTVNSLEPWVWYAAVLFRLMVTKPFVWLVGRWYGPRAMTWAESRSERGGRLVRWMERRFASHGWAVMLVTTSNPVCLLAGASGYPLATFLLIAVVGTAARLVLVDVVGSVLSAPIETFIDWVVDHRALVVAISVTAVAMGVWWERRHGASELDEFQEIERDLEAEIRLEEGTEPG
jgi:membrane protein DedA with SNARE-associated domain